MSQLINRLRSAVPRYLVFLKRKHGKLQRNELRYAGEAPVRLLQCSQAADLLVVREFEHLPNNDANSLDHHLSHCQCCRDSQTALRLGFSAAGISPQASEDWHQ